MLPGVGGQGNQVTGGASGPSESKSAVTFGNLVSGGSGGFNPFAKPEDQLASQLLKPQTLVIIGAIIVAGLYFLKRK